MKFVFEGLLPSIELASEMLMAIISGVFGGSLLTSSISLAHEISKMVHKIESIYRDVFNMRKNAELDKLLPGAVFVYMLACAMTSVALMFAHPSYAP